VHRHAHWEKGVVAIDRPIDRPEEATIAEEDIQLTDQKIDCGSAQLAIDCLVDRPVHNVECAQTAVDRLVISGPFLAGFQIHF